MAGQENIKQPDFDWLPRFKIVFLEYGEPAMHFAKLFPMSKMAMSRLLNGEISKYNNKIINTVCLKLGYNLEWFVMGLGPKQKDPKGSRLYDVAKLRLQIEDNALQLKITRARLEGVIKELDALKKQMQD